MHIDKHRYVLLAIAAFASFGVVIASQWHRRQHKAALRHDHASDLKAWENEGGNLAPGPATSARS